MERFTFGSDDYYAVDNDNCYEDQNEDYCGPAIDRLAAYEDTGLEPENMPYPIGSKVFYAETDGVLKGHVTEIIVNGYSISDWHGRANAGKDNRFVICHNSYNQPNAFQLSNVYRTREEAEAAIKSHNPPKLKNT